MITKKSFSKIWNKVKKCICTQKNSAAVLIYSIYEQRPTVSNSCSFLINPLLVSSTLCCFYTSSYRILWITWRYFQEFCNSEYSKWSANKKWARSLSKVVSTLTSTACLQLASQRDIFSSSASAQRLEAWIRCEQEKNISKNNNNNQCLTCLTITAMKNCHFSKKFHKLWTYTHNHLMGNLAH